MASGRMESGPRVVQVGRKCEVGGLSGHLGLAREGESGSGQCLEIRTGRARQRGRVRMIQAHRLPRPGLWGPRV